MGIFSSIAFSVSGNRSAGTPASQQEKIKKQEEVIAQQEAVIAKQDKVIRQLNALVEAMQAEQRKQDEQFHQATTSLKAEAKDLETEAKDLKAEERKLKTQLKKLKAQLDQQERDGKRQAQPFSRGTSKPNPKKPGRKKGQGNFSRRKAPQEAQSVPVEEVTLCGCPDCGAELLNLKTHHNIQVDLPLPMPITRHFVTHSGYCSHCQKKCRSRHAEQVSTAAGAAGVALGPNARGLAADMKHRLGIPYAKIAEFFKTAWDLPVTPGGLCQANARLAHKAHPVYQELLLALRECQAVHGDETGWRIGVLSAWLWVFTSEKVTVFTIERSRGHEVILKILGREFKGVLHSDFFQAYEKDVLQEWLKQKCLAHLLKDLSAMNQAKTRGAVRFPRAVAVVMREAIQLKSEKHKLSQEVFAQRQAAIEKQTDALIDVSRKLTDPDNRRMAKRLRKHRQHLFTFLNHEESQATNNLAERTLRYTVIIRKTGGCNKTAKGANTHAVLSSILVTAKKQGHNPVGFLGSVLTASGDLPRLVALPTANSP